MEIIEQLKRRRSIRKFLQRDVEEEKIRAIIECALLSPSSLDSQPWKFFIVRNKQLMEKLSEELVKIHPIWPKFLTEAPIGIVVAVDSDLSKKHFVEDGAIAAFSIWLAAADEGLGAMWYAVYGDERREQITRKILSIPKNFRIICIMCIGYPAEKPKEKIVKKYEDVVEEVG